MKNKKEFFEITSICRDDIICAFQGSKDINKVKRRVKKMTDSEMESLASRMSSDYLEQLYWISLKVIFEERFVKK